MVFVHYLYFINISWNLFNFYKRIKSINTKWMVLLMITYSIQFTLNVQKQIELEISKCSINALVCIMSNIKTI